MDYRSDCGVRDELCHPLVQPVAQLSDDVAIALIWHLRTLYPVIAGMLWNADTWSSAGSSTCSVITTTSSIGESKDSVII